MIELFIGVIPQSVTKLRISDIKLDLTIDFKTLYFILMTIVQEERTQRKKWFLRHSFP